ncbi:uncharacterized protein Tco025E_08689 [Trypanosoma conorhini]|uniref:Uncharacterized protein n=1 Tax=Trypanosoma conorhini TaxID=83891 RepID=A0A3R7NDA4_9TRYP|nr:uncharacterized protein Tco025E_08689 [Trypanosoma conorhini]RNF00974.1 hypothetical protein Tco025E_08689 [Trypanosoma conorhini]
MSRADKRLHRDHVVGTSKDAAVRLYAFANTRPGYQVVFAPEQPVIVLKTRKGAEQQHPCSQWAPLAAHLFSQRPNTTHAMYVADTTALPEAMEQGERVTPTVGPVVKRLSNVLAKLNAHEATMVAAGVSAPLAFKYVIMGEKMLGHADRLVRRLILLCPESVRPFRQLAKDASKRAPAGEYPKPQLVVLTSNAAQAKEWQEWLQGSATDASGEVLSLLDSWSISTNLKPSLFEAVAREAGSSADGTTVNLETHFSAPRVFRIDFVLSKETKKTEQRVTLSPLTTTGCDNDDGAAAGSELDEEEEEEEEGGAASEGSEGPCSAGCHCPTEASTVFGITALQHCRHPTRVMLEGRVMDAAAGILGTTQGRVVVHRLAEAARLGAAGLKGLELKKGLAVRVETSLERDEAGRTTLKALGLTPLTRMQEKRSMTVCAMAEVPSYNVSTTAHAYGALLVRGRKCVLVRSLSGEFGGMRLPFLLHDDAEESAMDCAVRALCEQCDISPDNFYIPSCIPPVCYYDRSGDDGSSVVCVTVYVALALTAPSGAARDAVEDEESPDEPYDWFGYAKATRLLRTEPERGALEDLQRCLRRAHDAGVYAPLKGFGVFGDDVAVATRHSSAPPSGSLAGLELMLVCAPGDTEGRATQLAKQLMTEFVLSVTPSTPREEVEQAALAALRAGAHVLVLCLSSDVDVNVFSEEELTHWSARGARPRVLTLLLPGVSEAIVGQRDAAAAAAFVYGAMLSDVLLTLDTDMEEFSPPTWGMLRLASQLNTDLALYCGLTARRPISFPPRATMTAANVSTSSEASLREITLRRVGRPLIAARLAPLLEAGALRGCCRQATILWAQGEVWLASRPHARGALTLDARSCCFALDEGEPWQAHEAAAARENVILLHVWATPAALRELEGALGEMLDGMLGRATPPASEAAGEDGLPPWD